jgi:DNA (cytosine-5)-methyltransferase 1
MTLNVLSLFSGIGGLRQLELGLERAGMTVVGQVEKDPYCLRVLAKHWPEVPRHDDVRTASDWWIGQPGRPRVDLVCGGFPCQDISNAGRRAGIRGERSGLWSYMADTVRVLRPRYVVMENVSAILVRGLDVVTGDLAEIGYDVQWDCIPAAAVGAPHRRDRWWGIATDTHRDQHESCASSERWTSPPDVLTDAESVRCGQGWSRRPAGRCSDGDAERAQALADADRFGRDGWSRIARPAGWRKPENCGWWSPESDVRRVAHGVPARVDRLRALGNAVVPQVAEHVGRLLMDFAAEVAE